MTNLKKSLGLRNEPYRFSRLDAAKRFAERCFKIHIVMLGGDNIFWVVSMSDASRMLKHGYEIAK